MRITINTTMSRNYKFVNKVSEFAYNPKKQTTSFYQLCQFRNDTTGKICVRKIAFDQEGALVDVYERNFSERKIKEFKERHPPNKYAEYPVCSLELVNMPSPSFFLEAQSELLNGAADCSGFAQYTRSK